MLFLNSTYFKFNTIYKQYTNIVKKNNKTENIKKNNKTEKIKLNKFKNLKSGILNPHSTKHAQTKLQTCQQHSSKLSLSPLDHKKKSPAQYRCHNQSIKETQSRNTIHVTKQNSPEKCPSREPSDAVFKEPPRAKRVADFCCLTLAALLWPY